MAGTAFGTAGRVRTRVRIVEVNPGSHYEYTLGVQ